MYADGRTDQAARHVFALPRFGTSRVGDDVGVLDRPPAARHVVWRQGVLHAAGFPEELSRALAGSDAHDVHRLIVLVQSGCPLVTALRITARHEALSA